MDENTTQSILQRLTKIETLLEVDVKNLEARVSKSENNNTWLWRTVASAIIVVLIGAITITFK